TELLKHQFFKSKAKDRKYLQQNLIASAPTIDSRSQKIKNPKRSGTSGRLHKNTEGDWVWSSDEEQGEDSDDSDDDIEEKKNKKKPKAALPSSPATDSQAAKSSPSSSSSQAPAAGTSSGSNNRTLNLVLRMRNPKRELNDIRFEYQPSKDTAEGIANELLGTGLIGQDDLATMAVNLKQLVSNPPPNRVITFQVKTGFNGNEQADEKALLGFAQLSLTD
ncbi:Uncharacterized protein FKW44_010366, partial [Caligus rogercresseyi]